jgi:hypothetical protein
MLGLVAVGSEDHLCMPGPLCQPCRLRGEVAVVQQGNELMSGAAIIQIRFAVASEVRQAAVKAKSESA